MSGDFKIYDNGPLPNKLAEFAIIAKNGKEFALFFEDALSYLTWCLRAKFRVKSYDLFFKDTHPKDFPLSHSFKGDSLEVSEDIQRVMREESLGFDGKIAVFNIQVEGKY